MIKNRFYTILIGNYIVFTLIIVLSIIGVLKWETYRVDSILSEPRVKEVVDYASVISENEISSLDENHINKLAGQDGSIQILNQNNKIIFESENKKGRKSFTDEEINCIPSYYDDPYIDIQKYTNDNKEKNISVSITYYDDEDKQQMLADISHDLKTPITVIKGYSKAICDNLVNENEINQYLMTISRKADDLDELINTFYEYSKMEHPNYDLKFERTDICEFLRVYLAQKYEELYISGVEIEVDIPEEIIYCNIDKFQMKRVFENLVSNAVKHNTNQISILFRVKKYQDKVKINIADNGYGIPKEIRSEVFKPFVVGEKSRTKKGSGLGLAISKKIIQAHKGSIKLVEPEENYNTEFEILLINE